MPPGELIAGIAIPKTADHCKGIYLKAMERATWSFALVSVAAQIEFDGDRVRQANIVLGGVAGIPWRVRHAEKLLLGRVINESLAEEAAEESASGSNPLEGNVYKIAMIKTLLKRALLELT